MVRDVYQRKIYALMRMNLAVARMKKATNEIDRAKALSWLNAWLLASGLRQFKLGLRHRKTQPPGSSNECP
jgi:hypothetical protein